MEVGLLDLLKQLGEGALIGILVGLAVRRFRPDWAKGWARCSNDGKAWLFWIGGAFFAALAIGTAFLREWWLFGFFVLFAILEVWAALRHGGPITPEMEASIEQSDPSKISWPWNRPQA